MAKLKEYEKYIGIDVIYELELFAKKLKGISIQNINSTFAGGGVAEILTRMIPLLQELGVNASWDIIKGEEKFFDVTKKMHNALHGKQVEYSKDEIDIYLQTNESNAKSLNLSGDIMFIHDPQPCALIKKKKSLGNKWI